MGPHLKYLTLIFGILASLEASAQMKPPPLPSSCSSDVQRLCSDKTGPREITKCLMGRFSDLGQQCKQEIERFAQLSSEAQERGGGAMSAFGGPSAMSPPIPLFSYDGRFSPGDSAPSFTENKMGLSIPFKLGDGQSLGMALAASELHIGDPLLLNTGKSVPSNLYRYEVGGQYFKRLAEGRTFTMRASIGYAGDEPSKATKDASYSFNVGYGRPGSGNGYWMYMVFMTNNGPIGNFIPIPGIVYVYKTPTFTGMFGFPMVSLQWTPVDPWSYSLSIFGTTLQTEIAYGHRESLQVFTGYSFTQQSYIPSERTNERDRLTLQEQKAAIGLRFRLIKSVLLETQIGNSFGRSIYVGDGFLNKDSGSVNISDAWTANVGLKYAF